jgi:hypothetical protein
MWYTNMHAFSIHSNKWNKIWQLYSSPATFGTRLFLLQCNLMRNWQNSEQIKLPCPYLTILCCVYLTVEGVISSWMQFTSTSSFWGLPLLSNVVTVIFLFGEKYIIVQMYWHFILHSVVVLNCLPSMLFFLGGTGSSIMLCQMVVMDCGFLRLWWLAIQRIGLYL